MSYPDDVAITLRASVLLEKFAVLGVRVACAESCTGGLIAAALTEVPGSSRVFECGFVTYSNASKSALLGVSADLIVRHGAVSAEVADAMARGACERGGVDAAVAVTGIAGPDGGSPAKPIGLVFLSCSSASGSGFHLERRYGDLGRSIIRQKAVLDALSLLDRAASSMSAVKSS